jgi:thioredoxin reductase
MTLLSNEAQVKSAVTTTQYDVVVVGAGPYGLSTAAHLLHKKDLNVAIFGKPLQLWREYMPRGMFLRSYLEETNLSDPQKKYTLEAFLRQSTDTMPFPIPIEDFINYGLWFQKNVVPNVDETYVSSVERAEGGFLLTLEDGRRVFSRAVVMAVGLHYYAYSPEEYLKLPAGMVSHSFEYDGFERFAGKTVAIIGRGQSATESAALLQEAGASVHLITRKPIDWLPPEQNRKLMDRIRWPKSGIAFGWKFWIQEHFPYLFYRVPQDKKDVYISKYYLPLAADWLRDRLIGKVTLHESVQIQKFEAVNDHVVIHLSNNEVVTVDHVLLGTGYKVDVRKLPMLAPSLLETLQIDERDYPVLSHYFESSVPGLYFVGLVSMRYFGLLYRFVAGAKASAMRVSGAATRHARRARRASASTSA